MVGAGQLMEKDDPGLEENHTRAVLRVMMDTPPKVRRSDVLRAGIKAQPRACGMPVAKRTLAELKADEKKTGLKVPLDLPADFPRGPWVVDLSKPPDHAPASGAHDGGKQATIIPCALQHVTPYNSHFHFIFCECLLQKQSLKDGLP